MCAMAPREMKVNEEPTAAGTLGNMGLLPITCLLARPHG